ncbi:MAG TPA: hypothetical protein VMA13_09195 [Candidatus Saccharimonadales bacterium]|nr:hypothetical protein [Candidatus Saccharimonadales bacterium]
MKTIRISEEVWAAIAAHGKFGETEDDVLRRVFKLSPNNIQTNGSSSTGQKQYGWKERRATDRMTQTVRNNKLILEFDSGARFEEILPPKENRAAIRKFRDEALEFVKSNGGTEGQEKAAIRALTSRGYHIAKANIEEFC